MIFSPRRMWVAAVIVKAAAASAAEQPHTTPGETFSAVSLWRAVLESLVFLHGCRATPQNLAFWHPQLIFCRNVQLDMPLKSEMSWPTLANSLASGKLIFPKRRDHEWPCQVARWHLVTLWRGSTAGTKQEVDYVNSDSRLLGRIFGVFQRMPKV